MRASRLCGRWRCELRLQLRVQVLQPLPVCLVAIFERRDAARRLGHLNHEAINLGEDILGVLLEANPDVLKGVGERPLRPRPGEMGRAGPFMAFRRFFAIAW